jgi:hypothetical protein
MLTVGEIIHLSTTPTGAVHDTETADLPKAVNTVGNVHALVLLPVRVETLVAPARPSMFTRTHPLGTEVVEVRLLKFSLYTVCATEGWTVRTTQSAKRRRLLRIKETGE